MSDESILKEILSDRINERRKDRRAGLIKTALVVGIAGAYLFGGYSLMRADMIAAPKSDYAAVVLVSGMIAADKEASYANLAPALRAAFEDTKAKGVVLQINSPGGTPVQSGLIHDLILELKAKHKKPVIAVGEDMLTSGAYMIAVAADKIYADSSTVAGSIGVISAGFGFTGIMDKVGVERRVATAGLSKNMLDPFMPKDAGSVEKQKELLNDIHGHFKDMVVASRGAKLVKDTPGLFEGSVWSGARAKTVGIIDELGSVDTAIKAEFNVEATKSYSRAKPIMASLFSNFGVQALQYLIPGLKHEGQPQVIYGEAN